MEKKKTVCYVKKEHKIIPFRWGFDVINPLLTDIWNNLCYIRRRLLLSADIQQISKYPMARFNLRKFSGAGKKSALSDPGVLLSL